MKRSIPLKRRKPLSSRGTHTWETVSDDGLLRVLECGDCDRRWRGFVDELPPEGPCNSLSRGSGLKRGSGPRPVSDRKDEKRPDLGTELEEYVEGLPCLLRDHPDHTCEGDVVAHHSAHKNRAGDWIVLSDGEVRGNLVSLCWSAHEEVHSCGRKTFEGEYNIDLVRQAERVGAKAPVEPPVSIQERAALRRLSQ